MGFEYSSLSEVADVIDSLHKTPSYALQGHPMVRVTDVKYGELQLRDTLKVDEPTFVEFSRRYKPEAGDIVITRVGTYGVTARVVETTFCLGQNTAAIIPRRINGRYLYAAMNSPLLRSQMDGSAVGSTQKTLSLKCINALQIPRLGEFAEATVATIIGALDDRIALLRETNATLEAMAQALFKSWFVDFDPVHANAGTRAAPLPAELQTLFPSTFIDTAQGLVPTGWSMSAFGDFIDRKSVGKKFDQKSASPDGLVPILDQGKSGIIGYHNEEPGVKASLENPVVVFANHTCYMRLITYDFSAIQNVLPFVGKGVDTVWAFYATKDRVRFSEYKGHWPDFAIEKCALPPQRITEVFRDVVDPLIKSTRNNEVQMHTLATLRDTLLPRLISGQLRLPDAKAALAEAGV